MIPLHKIFKPSSPNMEIFIHIKLDLMKKETPMDMDMSLLKKKKTLIK